MKRFILVFLLISLTGLTKAEIIPYISPGVQIGYGFGQGFFYSGQITVGFSYNGPRKPWEVGGGIHHDPDHYYIFPGVTFGKRFYKNYSYSYTDVQVCFVGIVGIGYGIGRQESKSSGGEIIPFKRIKVWGGVFVNATYDYAKSKEGVVNHNLGIIGVIPFGKEINY